MGDELVRYFFQVPVLNDIKAQAPQAVCKLMASNVQRNVLINREALPFNKPELRRAVALTIDRKAFIDTLTQGAGTIGGALLAPPGFQHLAVHRLEAEGWHRLYEGEQSVIFGRAALPISISTVMLTAEPDTRIFPGP